MRRKAQRDVSILTFLAKYEGIEFTLASHPANQHMVVTETCNILDDIILDR